MFNVRYSPNSSAKSDIARDPGRAKGLNRSRGRALQQAAPTVGCCWACVTVYEAVDKKASRAGMAAGQPLKIIGKRVGPAVESYQWFLLGMMVAWTPGLLVLALMLRRRNIGHDPRGPQRADRRRHNPNYAQTMDMVQIDRRATARRALKS